MKKRNFAHRWSILCTTSSVDTKNNNVSLFNIIEQVQVTKDPLAKKSGPKQDRIFVPMKLELVTLWEKIRSDEKASGTIEVHFEDPLGELLQKFRYELSMPKDRVRNFTTIDGFFMTEEGRYVFKIKAKSSNEDNLQDVGEVPLQVDISNVLQEMQKR
jgi:hypothetical protein